VGLKLNGTHQLLVYADGVNLLGDYIHVLLNTVKINRNLTGHRKEVGLEVNREKTKYMFLSLQQNAGHNYEIKVAN
jgi:hypothetical protein